MENKLSGTQTEQNLLELFKAEAVSVVKYNLFAEKSEYKTIEEEMRKIAGFEEEHAEVLLKLLGGLNDDLGNLQASIALEGFASRIDYPEASKVAYNEGFSDISKLFEKIGEIEEGHRDTFERLYGQLSSNMLLKRNRKVKWICLECGYIYTGIEPPEKCPVCEHTREHYEIYNKED